MTNRNWEGEENAALPQGWRASRGGGGQQRLTTEDANRLPAGEIATVVNRAINFLNMMRARFRTEDHVYMTFLEILRMLRRGNKTINEVYQEVTLLFVNHDDLVREFEYFLPTVRRMTNGAISVHLAQDNATTNGATNGDNATRNGATSVHDEFLGRDNDD